MSYAQRSAWRGEVLFAASWAAILGTETVALAAATWEVAFSPTVHWDFILFALFWGMILSLITLVGLAILGVPLAAWLGARLLPRWTFVCGIMLGAVAGGIFFDMLSILYAVADGFSASVNSYHLAGLVIGAMLGAPTGFWFWFFNRRVLLRQAASQA